MIFLVNTISTIVILFGMLTVAFASYDIWTKRQVGWLPFVSILAIALGMVVATTVELNAQHYTKQIEVKACLKDKGKP